MFDKFFSRFIFTKKVVITLNAALFIVFLSCKKKDNNNNSTNTTPTVTTCFQDGQAGIYFGDGVENGIPFMASNVSITKLSCTGIKIQSPANTYTIGSLNASSNNNYTGSSNTSESASVSFTVSGAQYTVNIQIGSSFQFTGTK